MPLAQIREEVKSFPLSELEASEHSLLNQRGSVNLRRVLVNDGKHPPD